MPYLIFTVRRENDPLDHFLIRLTFIAKISACPGTSPNACFRETRCQLFWAS